MGCAAELEAGPVEFVFVNASDEEAGTGIHRHDEGKTIQDMVDYIAVEATREGQPLWVTQVGAWFGGGLTVVG